VLGAVALVENVLPPVPSDAAIALGAFLSHRGLTDPIVVFLVVWLSNFIGAAAVYFAARRYGRRLFATPTGRRLLSPQALAVVEREYLRFGTAGVLIGRFIPGIRAVVPPFVGIINLGAVRALVPIAIHGAIWYGGLTAEGVAIGAQWERIEALIGQVNRVFGGLALVLALVAGVAIFLKRRRRGSRLWQALRRAAEGEAPAAADAGAESGPQPLPEPGDPHRDAALLVLELAYADEALTAAERATIVADLRERWGLDEAEPPASDAAEPVARRVARYRDRIVSSVGHEQRLALVERMWVVALEGSQLGGRDERLMRLAGDLLGLRPQEVEALRARVANGVRAPDPPA